MVASVDSLVSYIPILTLSLQQKPTCLISNLLRTLSPLGDDRLTRHNMRGSWPEKDPEQSRDTSRGHYGTEDAYEWVQCVISREGIEGICHLGNRKNSCNFFCSFSALELKVFFPWGGKSVCTAEMCRRLLLLRALYRATLSYSVMQWVDTWKTKKLHFPFYCCQLCWRLSGLNTIKSA